MHAQKHEKLLEFRVLVWLGKYIGITSKYYKIISLLNYKIKNNSQYINKTFENPM